MRGDLKRTLLIDAAIVAVLVVLALVLAPGLAIVGMVALLILILGAISFVFSEVRVRRRGKRQRTRPRGASTRARNSAQGRTYGPPAGSVAPRPQRLDEMPRPSRRTADRQTRRRPPGAGPPSYE